MSTDRPCITHDLELVHRADRPRPCTRRGQHYAACDNDRCRGCVPRSATHGMLCSVCWNKTLDALNRVGELIVHLRSIESAGQAIGERVATSRRIKLPLHESWLAADGMLEALGASPIPSTTPIDDVWGIADAAVKTWVDDLDHIVNTREGAKRAVVLVSRMQTALHRWPDSEAHYREVPYMLCPNCSERTLWRRAPLEYLDDLRVECDGSPLMYSIGEGYDYCEWSMDWDEFAEVYGPIFAEIADADDRAARRRKRPRVVLETEATRRASAECAAGEHREGCRAIECGCDCHLERTYSLWSPKQSVNAMRESAA